jgi:SAM-dependent methyltransferase
MSYDAYAPVYDATAQDAWSAEQAAWMLGWLRERGIMPASALDLACGTGGAALMFAAGGCRVLGVDHSAAMLEIARGKARDAGADVTFVQADIRALTRRQGGKETKHNTPALSFVVRRSSIVLVTCFDALNELTADDDLERVCMAAAAGLSPGGWFVFDMLDADVLTQDERDAIICNNADCVVYHRFSYDEDTGEATRRVVWLVREIERWWRGEETHTLRAWRSDEIHTALAAAGLRLVEQHDHAERVVYIAQRLK